MIGRMTDAGTGPDWATVDEYLVATLVGEDPSLTAARDAGRAAGLPVPGRRALARRRHRHDHAVAQVAVGVGGEAEPAHAVAARVGQELADPVDDGPAVGREEAVGLADLDLRLRGGGQEQARQ